MYLVTQQKAALRYAVGALSVRAKPSTGEGIKPSVAIQMSNMANGNSHELNISADTALRMADDLIKAAHLCSKMPSRVVD